MDLHDGGLSTASAFDFLDGGGGLTVVVPRSMLPFRRPITAGTVLATLCAVVGLAFAVRSLALAIEFSTPIPYSDQWAFVNDLRRYVDGDYGFLDLFAQHNEHRIFTARLSFFLDYFVFHLGNLSVVMTTYLVLALLAGVVSAVAASGRSFRLKLLLFSLALPAVWSVGGWINLGWAFQLQWAYVHLMPALSIVAFAMAGQRSGAGSWLLLCAACLFDVLAVFSMSSGLCTIAPILAVAVWTRARWSLVAGFVVFHAIAVGLFLWNYDPPPQELVYDPVRIVRYLAPYLGTAFPASAKVSIVMGAIGLVIAMLAMVAATWASAVRRIRLDVPAAVLLAVASFALAEGVATAIGRGGLPNPTNLALRYGTPSEVFWVALLLSAWRWLSRGAAPWMRGVFLALAVGAVAVSNTAGAPVFFWREWAAASDGETFNLINGVTTGDAATWLFSRPEEIQDSIAFLREHQLGPFAEQETKFRPPLNSLGWISPGSLPACAGEMDEFTVLDGGRIHLKGWAVKPGLPKAAAWMLAYDRDGVLLGYASPLQLRIDSARRSGRAVVRGYDFWIASPKVRSPDEVDLVAVFPGGTASTCLAPRVHRAQASQPDAAP